MGSVDRKSYSSNAIYLNGDLVARFTHKQHVVVVSSTEAEYFDVSDAYKGGLNTYRLLSEFAQFITPISSRMDNWGDMYMAVNLVTNKRSKDIYLTYHLIRECVNKGINRLEYISTQHNIAYT